jgi:ribosomal protein S18 acetylase RimI-like enzyme
MLLTGGAPMQVVDLVPRRERSAVRDLVAHAVGYPTPEKLDRVLGRYAADPARRLVGFERNGALVGMLGFERHGDGCATVWNIAVEPDARRQGVGRAMVSWLVEVAGMSRVDAETDRHAVGFYRRLGFSITSLGERYPGTERFRCVLDVRPDTEPLPPAHGQTDERRREHHGAAPQ